MLNISEVKDWFTFLGEMLENDKTTGQELLIEKLKKYGFSFVPYEVAAQWLPKDLPRGHKIPYMVKKIYHGRNPQKDKYDPTVLIGIDYYTKHTDAIIIYLRGVHIGDHELPWEKSHVNFKMKKDPTIFPSYLTHTQRREWRNHRQKFLKGGGASQFYIDHLPAVSELNPNMEF